MIKLLYLDKIETLRCTHQYSSTTIKGKRTICKRFLRSELKERGGGLCQKIRNIKAQLEVEKWVWS